MDVREQVRTFVRVLLSRRGDDAAFADGDALLDTGRLDSLAVIEMVEFLEAKFAVVFSAEEFEKGCFESVNTVVAMVEELRKK